MKLLIDLGNTRLKWAIANTLDLADQPPINNTEINPDTLFAAWRNLAPTPECLGIACVGSGRLLETVVSVATTLWPAITIYQAKSAAHCLGVYNSYPEPEKLGVDRWLSMIAGFNTYRSALCIVGCGTAITLDRLDSSGKHLGGLICPGLRLMRHALADGTENLKSVSRNFPFELANFTDAAIYNGALAAACGLIEHTLKHQTEELQLLLTGGDAGIIAAQLDRSALIEPNLVLRGLALSIQNP
ncbi:MAG: type III pantothenate kinase [Methylococcaceae bacterium]|nr:type III pantothenate kinase [Methylococcaceae bacterium]